MKQRFLLGLVAVALLCATPVMAKDKKEQAKEQAQGPVEAARQEKEVLAANINNLNSQQIRVAVLQQVLSEEVAKLRNVQAVFCDTYKLDVDKFRQGLYRYDEKQGKFVLGEPRPNR